VSPMPAPAADPRKVNLLVELLRERPRTYEELIAHTELGLQRRMLQTYLKRHLPEAGHLVKPHPNGRGPLRFSLALDTDQQAERKATDRALRALARGVLEGFFPLDGTPLERRVRARVFAFASGVPRFAEQHRKTLLRWIAAAEQQPSAPHWLQYETAVPRLVWPLGVLLRDGRRVYLQGLVEPGDGPKHTRNFALERVVVDEGHCGVERAKFTVMPETPPYLLAGPPHPSTLVDHPFSLIRPDADRAVEVRVRVSADQVRFLRDRKWHSKQKKKPKLNLDGTLDLTFGPVDCDEAVAWCSQWWQGITVLGDDKLRAAYEASLRDRLTRQQSAAPAAAPRPSRPKAQRRPPAPRP
jgi:hypothetical protein